MSSRRDISDKIVHFTSGDSGEEAFQRLCNIIREMRILGTSEKIRGGYKCVCFSEAPLMSLPGGLVNPDAYSRYSPFGLVFDKSWIFAKGGRPVIYQTEEEFSILPEEIRWRHVRYEPNQDPPVDFTWEREWRIPCDYLVINPSVAAIVIPENLWVQRMLDEHELEQDFVVRMYSQIMDEHIAEQYREEFPWRVYVLGHTNV
jgi:hypothetical protein